MDSCWVFVNLLNGVVGQVDFTHKEHAEDEQAQRATVQYHSSDAEGNVIRRRDVRS